uniref:Uncharacterized protein n=1 Tax=Quercus lobata TaxID=97700 RepID=A0A7N2LVK4_QUELO
MPAPIPYASPQPEVPPPIPDASPQSEVLAPMANITRSNHIMWTMGTDFNAPTNNLSFNPDGSAVNPGAFQQHIRSDYNLMAQLFQFIVFIILSFVLPIKRILKVQFSQTKVQKVLATTMLLQC